MVDWYISLYSDAIKNNDTFIGILLCFVYFSFTSGVLWGIFGLIFGTISDILKKRKGPKFEKKVKKKLENKFHTTVYRGLLFFRGLDDTTEMDLAFVTKKGIFCFECKYRNCAYITCSPLQPEWYVEYSGNNTEYMNNPLFQNQLHIDCMLNVLPKGKLSANYVPIFNLATLNESIIVNYAGHTTNPTSYWSSIEEDGRIILKPNVFGMKKFMKDYYSLPDVLSDEDVECLKEFLQGHVATKKELKAHADRKYHQQHFGE